MIRVGVTSGNTDKLKPTQIAFNKLLEEMVAVFGFKCLSFVNEQPENDEEILRGAKNRLEHFINTQGTSKYDYIVSFENGIKYFLEIDQWFDFVWVIVHDCKTGKRSYAFGQGVQFPSKYVLEAKRLGFEKHTVGSVIASHSTSANPSDPHHFLTGGRVKRADLLEQALLVALSQLLADK